MRWYVDSSGTFHSSRIGKILRDLASPYVKGMSPNCKNFQQVGGSRSMIRAKSCMLCWLRRCVWEWRPADTPVGFERLLGELQSESWIGDAAEIRTN